MISSNVVQLNTQFSIESRLHRMKELSDSIKQLQAEYDLLKKSVIEEYFYNRDTYMTDKGWILATYKEQIRIQFNTTDFKKNEPALYDKFCEPKSVFTFLLK